MDIKKKLTIFFIASVLILGIFVSARSSFVEKTNGVKDFLTQIENKTFDIRQKTLSENRIPPKDIVIVGIDNISHEYLTSYFGSWPLPRYVYADFLNYVETQNPATVGLDVLFVGSWNKDKKSDVLLAKTIKKYDNAVGAIYFDEYSLKDRYPLELSADLSLSSLADKYVEPFTYPNIRELYPEFLYQNNNLGHLNLERSKDGVIRTLPLIVDYKNSLTQNRPRSYANFAVKLLQNYYLQEKKGKDIYVKNSKTLVVQNRELPILKSGESILNWYKYDILHNKSSFEYLSFKDVFVDMQAQKSHRHSALKRDIFKDKIVLLGFTADSLSDLKTVPTTKLLPGVEIYATFLANSIDHSTIIKTSKLTDLFICLLLFLFTSFGFYKIKAEAIDICIAFFSAVLYVWLSFAIMRYFYLWIPVVIPVLIIFLSYVLALATKYIIKTMGYNQVYALATTDALTGLYNHRFFQNQLKINLEYCKRYNDYFSLIMIDIDKFKNFNDTYGHLTGDEVLRQVASLLKVSLRKADILCRYGGEEIAIILPHTKNQDAVILANKLCKTVAQKDYLVAKDLTVKVTISLGVSTYPENGLYAKEIIDAADKMLYSAKESGRNKVGNISTL